MQLSSLTLYATSTDVAIDQAQLIAFLASRKLIGAPLSKAEFLAGEDFFKSIVFLGCSPAIALCPEDGEQAIRIGVFALDAPFLYAHQRARPPLCLSCKAPIENWLVAIGDACSDQIECESCRHPNVISRLHFRKRACYTRLAIRIQPVFESEAVPDGGLLAALAETFGSKFKYAYI